MIQGAPTIYINSLEYFGDNTVNFEDWETRKKEI